MLVAELRQHAGVKNADAPVKGFDAASCGEVGQAALQRAAGDPDQLCEISLRDRGFALAGAERKQPPAEAR